MCVCVCVCVCKVYVSGAGTSEATPLSSVRSFVVEICAVYRSRLDVRTAGYLWLEPFLLCSVNSCAGFLNRNQNINLIELKNIIEGAVCCCVSPGR